MLTEFPRNISIDLGQMDFLALQYNDAHMIHDRYTQDWRHEEFRVDMNMAFSLFFKAVICVLSSYERRIEIYSGGGIFSLYILFYIVFALSCGTDTVEWK